MSIVKSNQVVTLPSKIFISNLSLPAIGLISYILFTEEVDISNLELSQQFNITLADLHNIMIELAELKYVTIKKAKEEYDYLINENELVKFTPFKKEAIDFTPINKNSGVYIIYSKYGYKIGFSDSLSKRSKMFKVALPFKSSIHSIIKCNHSEDMERAIHTLFKSQRLNGEWFKLRKVDFPLLDKFLLQYDLKREVNNG